MNSPVRGRCVLVCGARVAGAATARALLLRGASVEIADRERGTLVAVLEAAGARFVGDLDAPRPGTDLVVASPGWRLDAPLLVAARAAGIEVIGEIELAWRLRGPGAPPWLAVTGTNGKTTTVRMLESILRAAGLRALAVGNVGVPVVEAVVGADAAAEYDVLAVELSSYQLAWNGSGPGAPRPMAGALLNLAPDHLDWHGSMADYVAAKTAVWNGDIAIGNADDPVVADRLARLAAIQSAGTRDGGTRDGGTRDAGTRDAATRSAGPRAVAFTVARAPAPGEFGVIDGVLVDRAFGPGSTTTALLPAVDVRPAGIHNVTNALAAAALARAHGVDAQAVAAGLRAFVPDPHRNAHVATVGGVDYVDDSKATNPHAAAAALRAYRRVVWIAGGQLKGVDVDGFVAEVAARAGFLAGVVLLGADRGEIAAALARHAPDVPVIDVARTDDRAMPDAVSAAARLARAGDTVLLSPAAASYDMFTSYAERGERFAAAVRSLDAPSSAAPATSEGGGG